MKQTFRTSVEYKRSIHIKNLYQELKKDGIGTTQIETITERLCYSLPKHRQRTLVKVITNWRLQDAYKELRRLKSVNTTIWRREKELIQRAGVLDDYERLWRREITKYENECTSIQKKKLQHLRNKYKKKKETIPDEYEGITLTEQELPAEYSSTARTYGGIELDENEQSLLALPPKYATYEIVESESCEAEIEKALAKLRWERKRSEVDNEGNELPAEERNWHNIETKTIDMREFRATDLPFNNRIYAPKPLDNETETCLQNLKMKLNNSTKQYIEETQRRKREVNLTQEQEEGLRSLKEKKDEKTIVIFETDKSKRFACDSMNNYKTLGETHAVHDEVVNDETKARFEKEVNAHAGMWTRILNAGTETSNHDRIRSNMKSRNNPPAPLSILRKDHKRYEDEVIGPPGRPVCGGDVSYNRRLSHLISVLLTDVYRDEKTVCSSTEELLAEVGRLNDEGLDELDIVGSMDVIALYPSLDIDFTIQKVCEVLYESPVRYEGLNVKELGLYLSLVMNDDELSEKGVHTGCPKRRFPNGPRPNITGCGMREKEEDRHRSWVFPDLANVTTNLQRRMLVEAMRVVLKTLMETHTYEFAGVTRRQTRGGAIGMELTGVLAQVYMVWWDRQFTIKLELIEIRLKLHERYVDDSNLVAKQTEKGARYNENRIVITEETINQDEGIPDDERTMKFLQSVANSIHPSTQMTIDYPSRYVEGKVPMLDVKMWMERVGDTRRILYEHYEKEMASKSLIHAKSAIPYKMKQTVLTQEMLRIMLHCCVDLARETVQQHLNNFMRKMQYSGYDQVFRYKVAKSAIHAYRTIQANETNGIRPMHRPKTWQRTERMIEKEKKKKTWYRIGGFDSVLFVPTTPGGKLKRAYEEDIRRSGIRVKVVEKTGRTLKSQLQTSNPFKEPTCGREDCLLCTTLGQGNCNTEGVTYKLDCASEEQCEEGLYKGETGGNTYTRGQEHTARLAARDMNNSPLWRHCVEQHGGEEQTFLMSITGTFRNDAMLRQITEAVQINNMGVEERMNDRAEWNMTPVPRTVIITR